jgi:hypothetical protein
VVRICGCRESIPRVCKSGRLQAECLLILPPWTSLQIPRTYRLHGRQDIYFTTSILRTSRSDTIHLVISTSTYTAPRDHFGQLLQNTSLSYSWLPNQASEHEPQHTTQNCTDSAPGTTKYCTIHYKKLPILLNIVKQLRE